MHKKKTEAKTEKVGNLNEMALSLAKLAEQIATKHANQNEAYLGVPPAVLLGKAKAVMAALDGN